MLKDKTLLACLDAIEEKEGEVIVWGDTNVSLNHSELLDVIQENIEPSDSSEDVLNELIERALVLRVNTPMGGDAYRSRMAESVYLQSNLRQWFLTQKLENTKTLVSDYRFVRRPRRYPRRDNPVIPLIQSWETSLSLNKAQIDILNYLLVDGKPDYQLAGFQVRATDRILQYYTRHSRKAYSPTATIVCAGTGSGKTLAFYLPAMTQLAHDLINNSRRRVKILAIYPRNELLKDQFSETYEQARLLDKYLSSRGTRKIKIGTFFGDTFSDYQVKNTRKTLEFSTMLCPQCHSKMEWKDQDRLKGIEKISCVSCTCQIDSDEIGLTRRSQLESPPDILFTTTEMLNQRLGDSEFNKLFGVGEFNTIPLVLLDEVHTYDGAAGAQTSYLFKRWMKRSDNRPHFVGLSATLSDPVGFFSDLTGVPKNSVELVQAFDREMEDEGAEYLLALRGDAVSQSSLLSTTIQSTMLTHRMLDSQNGRGKNISKGVYGSKSFVFTDDLDVINRLYDQLLDAEGWRRTYQGLYSDLDRPSLAFLRSPHHQDHGNRQPVLSNLGQDWSCIERIGHNFTDTGKANISRTSSQDSGVENQSDIVVATASLEVGFNDPTVGAVIQHKAPRNVASYLQRKGRAGRKRAMRPWMITVLSDYGRDRVAFQQYEQLINPTVKMLRLPVENSHIQKMQASLATLEWIGMNLGNINLWQLLVRPKSNRYHRQLFRVKNFVEKLASDSDTRNALQNYLQDALDLNQQSITNVMWQPPRSIVLEFLPNLLHKLTTNWNVNGVEWAGLSPKPAQPMPEFIPANLFSELFLPLLDIAVERGPKSNLEYEWESMSFFQGLKEYAPGRVSKRFSLKHASEVDWLVPDGFDPTPGQRGEVDFEIEHAFKMFREEITVLESEPGVPRKVYQPYHIYTKRFTNNKLSETSNAMLNWKSEFFVKDSKQRLQIPPTSEWHKKLQSICFYTHEEMNPIELIRYSTGADAEFKFRKKGKEGANITFNWSEKGQPVGIGTRLWVDGMCCQFSFNDQVMRQMSCFGRNEQALRMSYAEDHFISSPFFKHQYFFASWVFECVVSAILVVIEENNLSVSEAMSFLGNKEGRPILEAIPFELFQLNQADSDSPKEQELQKQLLAFLQSQANVSQVLALLSVLYEPLDSKEFYLWLRELLGNTLSAGLSRLINTLLPDVGDGDINVDHKWTGDSLTIWATESESGGVGVMQRFKKTYLEDPLSVLNHFSRTFEAEDYEQVDFDLRFLLSKPKATQSAFNDLRNASSYKQRFDANLQIQKVLGDMGVTTTQTLNNMLHTRVLRSGSNNQTDDYLNKLLGTWVRMEEEYKVEIPLNIASYILARRQASSGEDISDVKNKILSLLWPRGSVIRQSGLSFYNRFVTGKSKTERLLLEPIIGENSPIIAYATGWERELVDSLKVSGKVVLELEQHEIKQVNQAISRVLTLPVEQYGLLLYPRLRRIRRQFGKVQVIVEIAEVVQ